MILLFTSQTKEVFVLSENGEQREVDDVMSLFFLMFILVPLIVSCIFLGPVLEEHASVEDKLKTGWYDQFTISEFEVVGITGNDTANDFWNKLGLHKLTDYQISLRPHVISSVENIQLYGISLKVIEKIKLGDTMYQINNEYVTSDDERLYKYFIDNPASQDR